MNLRSKGLNLLLVIALLISIPGGVYADLAEGMSQGDFALWLVKAIGAQSKLPPAATADEAIDFLQRLGVVPEGGWDKNGTVDSAFLKSLLGEGADTSGAFEELLEKVRAHVQSAFDNSKLGVARFFGSSASGSAVAG